MSTNQDLLKGIETGASLKHVETADKSGPVIEGGVQLKKHDRAGLLGEITTEHKLNHAETVDKSAPVVSDAKVGQNNHAGLFAEVKAKGAKE
ncbi:hypothetical protein PROFUN_01236 [Planoprotostelium fungivorum]|uniref:WH2 domain-containing protein n=1 Tax=Planoprotostelium fungivorum TaxID=1890364 RepID=A0A2P6NZH7_9EUKA|nr:hypothetical protein PROFUN_01236 [Planoprotostelium fungivorum]